MLILGIYASSLIAPVVWKKQELGNLVKEHAYQARRTSDDRVRESLISSAKRELGIDLIPEDIFIENAETSSMIRVIWRPVIRPILLRPRVWALTVSQKVLVL